MTNSTQHAIKTGSLGVVAEFIANGADIDESITNYQTTPLEYAAEVRNLDMVRFLLRQGASPDHVDARGLDVSFCCWFPALAADKKICASDIFDILNEYIVLDRTATWGSGFTALHSAAIFSGAKEIDFLIRRGYYLEQPDNFGRTALYNAARRGNRATYFALLKHGATTESEKLLRATIIGKARKAEDHRGWYVPAYEDIANDLLNRGVDLSKEMYLQTGWTKYPESIRGRRVTIPQLAAAYGPHSEAWFLGVMECSSLKFAGSKESFDDNGVVGLNDLCFERSTRTRDDKECVDIFWDAVESL